MRAISIGAVRFDIPDWLDARDDDGTLVAYPPETDYANMRVSVSTIAKDGEPSSGAGEALLAASRRKSTESSASKTGRSGIHTRSLRAMVLLAARSHFGMSVSVRT
jgi:hypothetical protein